jgi:uncharacterized protein (TIGR04222 family)
MNPFDLPGPPFLLFYVVFAVAIHLLWRPLARFLFSPSAAVAVPSDRFNLENLDPYLVAYLRGREPETARVAIVSLLDRGLLAAEGDKLTAKSGAASRARRPLEREILKCFASTATAATIFKHDGFAGACRGLRDELAKLSLVPTGSGKAWAVLLRLGLLGLLAGVAIIKINVAIARGRSNFGFLILLSAVAVIAMLVRKSPVRTRQGEVLLDELRDRFGQLNERGKSIKTGGGSHELVLLAAIFGLTALPAVALAETQALFPRSMQAASGSCGSGCGSASSSCGGSSCGGGGCGGGCGGCG